MGGCTFFTFSSELATSRTSIDIIIVGEGEIAISNLLSTIAKSDIELFKSDINVRRNTIGSIEDINILKEIVWR
ncbi:hypothetical protein MBAV_006488 [Candidatus Magnetobacterium bavaricum]|uniref:Uncharacterized protein n=1 Tax=Candidatus Magnetobacterium bavaricum TaxID=29290 RepID=A0A0F3GHE3_9BACT|nr:hypothetical protein MBAV_006488 [Candidatus Magnetobacterium bavaricum]